MSGHHQISKKAQIIQILGLLAGLLLMAIILMNIFLPDDRDAEQKQAMLFMEEMIAAVSENAQESGIHIDPQIDPGKSGLIGPEWTSMTTTIGHLDAKKTSCQPEFAALMVTLLKEAGITKGDQIGLACSGSFPGLLLASLAAAKAMKLHTKTILSLGASSYGANRMELTILDIYQILVEADLLEQPPVAVSLGGTGDQGQEWEAQVVEKLRARIKGSHLPFIDEASLVKNVRQRASILGIGNPSSIKLLINAGGAVSNIGTHVSILKISPVN